MKPMRVSSLFPARLLALAMACLLSLGAASTTRAATATEHEVLPIWPGVAPGSETWTRQEVAAPPRPGADPEIRNVVRPTLTVYLPDPAKATGMAAVLAPGSRMVSIDMQREGVAVAKYLNEHGIAAFILKYRLADSGTTEESFNKRINSMLDAKAPGANIDGGYFPEHRPILALATEDLRQALRTVRQNAARWRVDPAKIGIVGFSSGTLLVNGVLGSYDAATRPDFAVGVHGYGMDPAKVPANGPPVFLACAHDDVAMPPTNCTGFYDAWKAKGNEMELHIYSRGTHMFNMIEQGLPSDRWIDRLGDWLQMLNAPPAKK